MYWKNFIEDKEENNLYHLTYWAIRMAITLFNTNSKFLSEKESVNFDSLNDDV